MQRAFRVDNMKIIGDPHLGRAFVNNVPLHRRGHREQMLRDIFVRELKADGAAIHVCVGDLFDKPTVSLNDIWFAANAYITAAHFNSSCDYFILAGNHDLNRDQSKVSAFHIFRHLLRNVENIHVVITPQFIAPNTIAVPWSPIFNAAEMLADWTDQAEIAVGHWDLDGNSPNLIPIEALKKPGVKRVYNGHVHLPRIETREGIEIVNVGSLVPLAHGEDHGEMYITMTLEEVKRCLES